MVAGRSPAWTAAVVAVEADLLCLRKMSSRPDAAAAARHCTLAAPCTLVRDNVSCSVPHAAALTLPSGATRAAAVTAPAPRLLLALLLLPAGEATTRWDPYLNLVQDLGRITAADLEVVDTGGEAPSC